MSVCFSPLHALPFAFWLPGEFNPQEVPEDQTEEVSSMFAHFSGVLPASPLIMHIGNVPPTLPSSMFISNKATGRGMEGLPDVVC